MPSVGLVRTAILRRLVAVLELDLQFEDIQVAIGEPSVAWEGTSRFVALTRVTGSADHPLLMRPVVEDHPVVEIWVQGFASDQLDAADIAEETASMVVRSIHRNRQLALDDDRLAGVQTCQLDELDGPLFLRTDQGAIVSFRMTLNVITRVKTED